MIKSWPDGSVFTPRKSSSDWSKGFVIVFRTMRAASWDNNDPSCHILIVSVLAPYTLLLVVYKLFYLVNISNDIRVWVHQPTYITFNFKLSVGMTELQPPPTFQYFHDFHQ